MFCTQCGHQNPDNYKFCSHCGHPLKSKENTQSSKIPGFSESFVKVDNDFETGKLDKSIDLTQQSDIQEESIVKEESQAEEYLTPQNQYEEDGNIILPVSEHPKSKTGLLIAIITALLVSAGGIMAYYYYVGSAFNIDKNIEHFSVSFSQIIASNDRQKLIKIYPDVILADSLTLGYNPNDISITRIKDEKDQYQIDYSGDVTLIVKKMENGEIVILESIGLFAFDKQTVKLAKKLGLWDKTANDVKQTKIIKEDLSRIINFSTPDLDLFNLHGPVKEMTISYSGDSDYDRCFKAWSWPGLYEFDSSGAWTNYTQRFPGGVRRNSKGQIIGLYEDYDDPNAPNFERPPFVEYEWKNNHVIAFESGCRTGNYAAQGGSLTYNKDGIISGQKMELYDWFGSDNCNLKLYNYKFDQFGNWISCSWKETIIHTIDESYYTMEDGEPDYSRTSNWTISGTITRTIYYYSGDNR